MLKKLSFGGSPEVVYAAKSLFSVDHVEIDDGID